LLTKGLSICFEYELDFLEKVLEVALGGVVTHPDRKTHNNNSSPIGKDRDLNTGIFFLTS
jgi:hypothetical protein